MTTNTNVDSLYAFPFDLNLEGERRAICMGMTLRDYFAAKAMTALISLPEATGTVNYFAAGAYQYADAMLKARSV